MNDLKRTSKEWKSKLTNVEAFNEYAKEHPVELYNVTIENKLDGIRINKGILDSVFWRYTSAKNGIIENTEFTNIAFERMDFRNTIFKNVVFKDSVIANSKFNFGQMDNVKFIDTQLVDDDFEDLKPSRAEYIRVGANNASWSGSAVHLSINDSEVYDSKFYGLAVPSSVEITDSEFVRSRIDAKTMTHFKLINSMTRDSGISTVLEGDALVDGGDIESFGLGVGAKNIIVRNLSDGHIGIGGDFDVDVIQIENCKNMVSLAVGSEGYTKQIKIKNVKSKKLYLQASKIDLLEIRNSEFKIWDFEEAKIKNLLVDDVSLTGTADFIDATIDNHNLKDLKTRKHLKLKLDNSNITPEDLNQ